LNNCLFVRLCVGKKWLFWFYERWFVCRGKPNVPFAGQLFTLSDNGPFAAAGWEFRERKLGKSTKDY